MKRIYLLAGAFSTYGLIASYVLECAQVLRLYLIKNYHTGYIFFVSTIKYILLPCAFMVLWLRLQRSVSSLNKRSIGFFLFCAMSCMVLMYWPLMRIAFTPESYEYEIMAVCCWGAVFKES